MSAIAAANEAQNPAMVSLLGMTAATYETFVYRLAEHLTEDDETASAKKYRGGQWALERIESPEFGVAYWWRLESKEVFRLVNSMNHTNELVDAEMLSMVVGLMATSDLCIRYSRERSPEAERWNGLYHDMHHALREHFFFLLRQREDQGRIGMLLRLID